jgi:hypothetical protein
MIWTEPLKLEAIASIPGQPRGSSYREDLYEDSDGEAGETPG